jgi:hypothetical protein
LQQRRITVAQNLRAWESRQGRQNTPELADKRVYLVSKGTLIMATVNEKSLGVPLGERDLLEDLAKIVIARRF